MSDRKGSKEYSWSGVMEFLQDHHKAAEQEKHDLFNENAQLHAIIKSKDEVISDLELENKELSRRVKMLEYALRQERFRYSKMLGGHKRVNSDLVSSFLHRNSEFTAKRKKNSPWMITEEIEDKTLKAIHKPSRSFGSSSSLCEKNSPKPRVRVWREQDVSNFPEPSLVESVVGKKLWKPKATLKSHFDGVRALHFLNSEAVLASASEDCTIKLWDLRYLESEDSNFESYFTLRGHSGGIFALTGGYSWGGTEINENLLYSGGQDGTIRVWEVPFAELVDPYSNIGGKNFCVGVWEGHQDAVWSLSHNPVSDSMLSASADGSVMLWKLPGVGDSSELTNHPVKKYNLIGDLTPTACAWVQTDLEYFAAGYNSHFLTIFNKETGIYARVPFAKEQGCTQINSLLTSPTCSLAIAGHEDKRIRFFDLRTNVCVKEMVGHTDGVTSVSIHKSGLYLVSGGHDGSLRSWDLRKHQCIHEIPAHRKKYDEAVHAVANHPTLPLLASGGADSLVKLFESN